MDSQRDADDFIANSWYMQHYGPDRSDLDAMFKRKERIMARNRTYTSKVDQGNSNLIRLKNQPNN